MVSSLAPVYSSARKKHVLCGKVSGTPGSQRSTLPVVNLRETSIMPTTSTLPPVPMSWYLMLGRSFKGFVVFLVVVFHLVVMAIRNPLDLWYGEIRDWLQAHPADSEPSYWDRYGEDIKVANEFTWKYSNLVGWEQNWCMFRPPIAREISFLAVRLEFTDGSSEVLRSENEPDPRAYVRVGGWQQRKLEFYLVRPPDDLASHEERPLWEAYARYKIRQWRADHPLDPRTLKRVVFLRRRYTLPQPGEAFPEGPPREQEIAFFDPRGRLQP
jgi:hypothetical protein